MIFFSQDFFVSSVVAGRDHVVINGVWIFLIFDF